MSVEIGQILDGKYKITRLIGQGGMGAVYEGVHQLIDRKVAIKVLLPHQDESSSERFQQEARAAGRIGNDHILEVLDLGALSDGAKYMVCEYLDGQPFSDLIEARGRLTPEQIVPLALQLLSGLGAAHNAGVIHRDLKPDNIFVLKQKAGKRDFIKIIDFGISKFSQLDGGEGLSMTKTGMMVGTPNYMSPEQARGLGKIDARADLYAVGVILYEAVSGQLPYSADTFNDLLFKVVLEDPTPLEQIAPELPSDFIAIVKKAMARDPNSRFATAQEFSAALETWSAGHGVFVGSVTGITASVPPRVSQATPQSYGGGPPTSSPMKTMVGEAPASDLIQATLSTGRYSNAGKSAATPGAFGNTSPHSIIPVTSPWWTQRPAQIGILAAVACSLIIALVIVWGNTDSAPSSDSQSPVAAGSAVAESAELPKEAKTTEAAREIEEPSDKSVVPDAMPSDVQDEKPSAPQPRPSHRPAVASTAPAPRVAPAPAPRVIPAPTPPTPTPSAPTPEPKRRVDFGY